MPNPPNRLTYPRAVACTDWLESISGRPSKKPPCGGSGTFFSIFNKKIKLDPRKVPSAEYDEPRCEVHRIRIFFKPPKTLPSQKAKLYQYSGGEINFTVPSFRARQAFLPHRRSPP
jgi:hypothetical protein